MTDELQEEPAVIDCDGDRMIGIFAIPKTIKGPAVLIVVGGPQYRVGSHRQFTLLARTLAAAGIPSLRYDYRGMGDSEGAIRTFEHVSRDLRAGIDALVDRWGNEQRVVIWGLCDAASAAAMYACDDARVIGLVLLNPWVRTAEGEARALLKHYYVRRLFSSDLWYKLLGGQLAMRQVLKSMWQNLVRARRSNEASDTRPASIASAPLPHRMAAALARFSGKILFVLSGSDLTAQEFRDVVCQSKQWRRLYTDDRISQRDIAEANHTFSTRAWRDSVALWTVEWTIALARMRE
jgi:exosortase A-associated hydrolase 1